MDVFSLSFSMTAVATDSPSLFPMNASTRNQLIYYCLATLYITHVFDASLSKRMATLNERANGKCRKTWMNQVQGQSHVLSLPVFTRKSCSEIYVTMIFINEFWFTHTGTPTTLTQVRHTAQQMQFPWHENFRIFRLHFADDGIA